MKNTLFKNSQECFLIFTFFIFGFGWAALYVPVITCYAIIYNYNNRALSWKMNSMCWINYLFAIFFILFTYLPGLEYMVVDSPVGTFLVVLFLVGITVPIFNSISIEQSIKLLHSFLFGLFIYVTSVVLFALLTDPIGYNAGSLVSPFVQDLRYNTSAFSNYLAIVSCGYLYFILIEKRLVVKCMSFAILLAALTMAISLGGRAYFIMLFIFTALLLFRLNSFKVYLKIITVVLLLLIVFYYYSNEYLVFADVLLSKFDTGLETTRYEHWEFAIQKIPDYPLGGFDVNQQIEEIHSFHNIFFDAGKFGGWLPMFLLLVIISFNFSVIFFIKKSVIHVYFFWIFSFILILNMMQDVILEGTYKFYVLFVMANCIIFKFRSGTKYSFSQGI